MSTRIIVKNLPKNITEDELRKHFSQKGDVTDVKIMKKENGQSRNFCFIGYRTESSAKEAVKYFNGTYVRTVKVAVEIAKLQNDPSLVKKGGKSVGKNKGGTKQNMWSGILNNNDEENTKESKIKKILELSKQTKNADKFDEAIKQKKNEKEEETTEDKKENEKIEEDKTDNDDKKEEDEKAKPEEKSDTKDEQNKQKQLDPKRLYLRNLPFQISEEEIRNQFSQYGQISEIHIPINHKTSQSFGYAYVGYETVESSVMAISKMDGQFFQGRRLHISIAEEKSSKPPKPQFIPKSDQDFLNKSSFKKEKKQKMKENYNNETNWNYLFLNQNAVVETISSRLGIPKTEILNKDNADLAVQIAAMETSIINETKTWLQTQGINLDILKGKRSECTRSKNIIFVKNISTRTTKENLEKIFSRFGSLVRFMVSPSNTLAICEYVNSKHAQNCMKHLAYYEVDGEPIYLEFAPEGIISKDDNNKLNEEEKEEKEDDIDLVNNQGKILFVSNLNFSTKEKSLKHFFESKDYKVAKVQIATHLKEGKNVSSGYGFVEFKTEETLLKALKNLNGHLLEGHSIKLSISKTSSNTNDKLLGNKRKKETELNDYEYENENISNTKLLIKNLAFEANKEELRKLFKVYGQVKTVRLPLKIDGSHRGFAFIEFMSHEEAQKAFKELQNTHFYGRKIVIEWAQQEKTVEELREKTQKKAEAINIQTHKTQNKGQVFFK